MVCFQTEAEGESTAFWVGWGGQRPGFFSTSRPSRSLASAPSSPWAYEMGAAVWGLKSGSGALGLIRFGPTTLLGRTAQAKPNGEAHLQEVSLTNAPKPYLLFFFFFFYLPSFSKRTVFRGGGVVFAGRTFGGSPKGAGG